MTMIGQEKPSLEDLAHHGVKGMKWGVRRDSRTGARPLAVTLNNSRLGQAANRNAERHMAKQRERAKSTMDKQALKAVRLHNSRVADNARQRATIEHPSSKDIREARKNHPNMQADVARAHIKYKTSKAQYKINKQTMGKSQARLILEKNKGSLLAAKARRDANFDTALKKTTDELISDMIKNMFRS